MVQELYNVAVGLAGTLGAFLLYALWNAVKDLQEDDKKLVHSIANLEKIVVGDYIKRAEMERAIRDVTASFEKQLESQSKHLEVTFERFMKQDMDSHDMILMKLERMEKEWRDHFRIGNNHG